MFEILNRVLKNKIMIKIFNEDDVKNFLTKCGQRRLCFTILVETTPTIFNGNFRNNKLKLTSVNSATWNYRNYGKTNYPIYDRILNKKSIDEIICSMKSNCNFMKISCKIYSVTWRQIHEELKKAGKLKYDYVPEDSRSGCNLIKYLTIDGLDVDHNPHRDCMRQRNKERFYKEICLLYRKLKAPGYARKSIYCLIAIRKYRSYENNLINSLPKEIVLLIAKCLYQTKHELCWMKYTIENLMAANNQSIDVIYGENR